MLHPSEQIEKNTGGRPRKITTYYPHRILNLVHETPLPISRIYEGLGAFSAQPRYMARECLKSLISEGKVALQPDGTYVSTEEPVGYLMRIGWGGRTTMQKELFDRFVPAGDVVYTPDQVSKQIIDYLNPCGLCLDPCRGDGAFFKYLPNGSEYCEITEGKDFFEYRQSVNWIIGNPPYSNFKEFLQHAFQLADNVSFLVPTNKIFQRQVIMDMIVRYGGIKSMIVYGSGSLIGFPFGFSVGNFHFKRDYKGQCDIKMGMRQLF